MPNRLIYENALTSRKVNALTDSQEKFWWRLILCCDDYGCFFGEPDVLLGKVYPRQRVSEESVLEYRDALVSIGLAFLYEHDGETYICINKWEDLQTVRTPRRKFPKPPNRNTLTDTDTAECDNLQQNVTDCDKAEQTETDCSKKMSSRARPQNPSRIHLEYESNPKRSKKDIEKFFETAWSAYPKKLGKGKISQTAKERACALGEEFMRCIQRYVDSCANKEEQFIMYGSTFFNSGYVDYLDANYTQTNTQRGGKGNGSKSGINRESLKGFHSIE
jgi:hypothetical protein